MIDIHSHILYGVDDGPKTIKKSIALLRMYSELGIKKVIATPHYKVDICETDSDDILSKCNELNDISVKEDLNVKVYTGNEIMLNSNIEKLLENKEVLTLGYTQYILIEMPFTVFMPNTFDILYRLKLKGYKVIMAHPERYYPLMRDTGIVKKLKELNILFQLDIMSLYDSRMKEIRKFAIYLLKNSFIDIVASDVHSRFKQQVLLKEFINSNKRKIKTDILKKVLYNNKIINYSLIEESNRVLV
jgi:protein-tyrosine phosphatase